MKKAASNGKPTTVADAVVAQLAAAGVARVYGVIGDAVFPLAGALERQRKVQFVATAHEANAAYMASYEAKLTGRPTACMATSGPGATNLATGVADAFFDGAPVIALTGQVESSKFGLGTKQYFDQQTFFRPITSSSELALSGEAALHAVLAGLRQASSRSTAVHVSIPKDVFEQPVQWTPVRMDGGEPGADGARDGPVPGPILVLGDEHEAVARLRDARSPLLLLGLSTPDVVRESLALAEQIGAAVVTAQQAKGAVAHDFPRLIGGIGEAHVPPLVQDADLLLLIGEAPYELPFIPPHVPSVVIAPVHRPLAGHPLIAEWNGPVPTVLRSLQQALERKPNSQNRPRSTAEPDLGWQEAIRLARIDLDRQRDAVLREDAGDKSNPYRIALALSEALAEDAVVAVDIGAFSHWFDLGFRSRGQTVLASAHWRGIGFALPAAIAARFARPNRQAVAVVGDGALLQAMGELTTAVRCRLPVVVVVVDNAVYDIERQKMKAQGQGDLGTALPSPDFVAYAEACGARGLRVSRPEDLSGVFAEALAAEDGPVLIDVPAAAPVLPHLVGVH